MEHSLEQGLSVNDKPQDSKLLVWSNRAIMLLFLMLLTAISQFPEMRGFWEEMNVCNSGLCGFTAASLTHPLVRYIAYAIIIVAIAKEWMITPTRKRVKFNLWMLLVSATLFLTMMLIFNLPLLEMEPI